MNIFKVLRINRLIRFRILSLRQILKESQQKSEFHLMKNQNNKDSLEDIILQDKIDPLISYNRSRLYVGSII